MGVIFSRERWVSVPRMHIENPCFSCLVAWPGIKRGDEVPIYSLNILVNLIDSD